MIIIRNSRTREALLSSCNISRATSPVRMVSLLLVGITLGCNNWNGSREHKLDISPLQMMSQFDEFRDSIGEDRRSLAGSVKARLDEQLVIGAAECELSSEALISLLGPPDLDLRMSSGSGSLNYLVSPPAYTDKATLHLLFDASGKLERVDILRDK
jgi:hypothetical protein